MIFSRLIFSHLHDKLCNPKLWYKDNAWLFIEYHFHYMFHSSYNTSYVLISIRAENIKLRCIWKYYFGPIVNKAVFKNLLPIWAHYIFCVCSSSFTRFLTLNPPFQLTVAALFLLKLSSLKFLRVSSILKIYIRSIS